MQHQTVTFGECRGFSITTIGLLRLHINNLKIAIREVLALIDQNTLSAVTANFEKCVQLCIQQRGSHFEHLF